MQHNVLNIPAGLPFSKNLAQYLTDKSKNDGRILTEYRVLLPTRRACRILRDAFLDLNDGKPMLLPQLSPIGDVDEEDLSLLIFGNAGGFLDVPEAVSPMKRQLMLARLIRRVPDFAQGADHALALASALAHFIDQVIVEGLDFADLYRIVPDDFAAHWQITIEFLRIISENWPKMLASEGLIEATERRNILLQALSEYWRDNPPDYPVIAAGATGSIPAVSGLLSVISAMPCAQVILPGVDLEMDDDAWEYVSEAHPQFMLRRLLHQMGVERSDIVQVVDIDAAKDKRALVSSVMLPAQATYQWKDFARSQDLNSMSSHVEYYPCATQGEEAKVISLIMRQSLDKPRHVTALVTPDRVLARRVSAQCRKWGIEVDDSAGQNLADSRLGKFLILTARVELGGYDAVAMLSLLKMSYCRFSQEEDHFSLMVDVLENVVLRSDDPITSHEMLREKVVDNDMLLSFVDSFYAALLDLKSCKKDAGFKTLLIAHVKVAEALACLPDQEGSEILWRGDVGESAARFFTDLIAHAELLEDVDAADYEAVISSLMRSVTVRSAYGVHPRLLILGQLEARLADADTIILGGLNEGTWPPDAGHDPWMSRPMRKAYGLPAVEQSVGLAAHDFVQGFCAAQVIITRSEKVGGSPTVPARWLDRLDAVLQGGGMDLSDLSRHPYRDWARLMDDHDDFKPYERPKPRPPVSTRPKGVSVTKFESWMQNPYAIYMHYVLRLRKLRPLLQDNDAALRGTITHKIIERFCVQYPLEMPDDAEGELISIAREVLREDIENPEALHFWWPKFMRLAAWFAAHEEKWRQKGKFAASEVRGNIDIEIDGENFNIYGVADRIDRMHGGYAIIDYKTGKGNLRASKIKKGELPQIPLEALMLKGGGFNGRGFKFDPKDIEQKKVPAGDTAYMGYWILNGKGTGGEVEAIESDLDDAIETVLEGVRELIRVFRNPETPYLCVPNTANAPRFNDYEHVSRLKEWAALDDSESEGRWD